MAKLMASVPGGTKLVVDKFAKESKLFSIDTSSILEEHEAISSIGDIHTTLTYDNVGTRLGKLLDIRILPIDMGTARQIDAPVSIMFNTTFGSVKELSFVVRNFV